MIGEKKEILIYVKQTTNCEGMQLTTFELLSPIWKGKSVLIPFGSPPNTRRLKVVGWTDLYGGMPCQIKIAKVRIGEKIGWLIWGGNAGVRILDSRAEDWSESHLPRGYGMPVVWVEDCNDLPANVRRIVCNDPTGEETNNYSCSDPLCPVHHGGPAPYCPEADYCPE
jgi:hypothetical protein